VGYGSKRQQSVALSSTEAEIMAASLAACEVVFMRGLLREMGVEVDNPTVTVASWIAGITSLLNN
jgi:uncharacterized OsmC-like protein